MPPENATYARSPARAGPSFTTSPPRRISVVHAGASAPFTVKGIAAPVRAIAHSASATKRGPSTVHSRPAAPSGLPASRLAVTNAA